MTGKAHIAEKGPAVCNGPLQSDPLFVWDNSASELPNMDIELCDESLYGRNASLGDGLREALSREPLDTGKFCFAASSFELWNL